MDKTANESYKTAGVDLEAGYDVVRRIKAHVERTRVPGMLGGLGGFGGLFAPNLAGLAEPVLVSGADGVGTKLKIAFLLDKHDTVGIDCVAMCVNDILCSGAKPLFFLDYVACGKNVPARVEAVVAGVAEGCVQAGCALLGGETAEMPGFYPEDEYDLAGFAVGLVDRPRMLDPARLAAGDVVLGLPSTGVHSNGFSLVRKIFGLAGDDTAAQAHTLAAQVPELGGTLGEALLTPTAIYVRPVLALLEQVAVHGICHITGGGFFENIPRMLPGGLSVRVDKAAIPPLPIFALLAKQGNLGESELYNTFNMGVGLCIALAPADADKALAALRAAGQAPFVLGEVVTDDAGVLL